MKRIITKHIRHTRERTIRPCADHELAHAKGGSMTDVGLAFISGACGVKLTLAELVDGYGD